MLWLYSVQVCSYIASYEKSTCYDIMVFDFVTSYRIVVSYCEINVIQYWLCLTTRDINGRSKPGIVENAIILGGVLLCTWSTGASVGDKMSILNFKLGGANLNDSGVRKS